MVFVLADFVFDKLHLFVEMEQDGPLFLSKSFSLLVFHAWLVHLL